ncbi:hypothetical protein NBRC3255_1095 [Gluconobacter thailandicus NBRC 3255]|nr:hypothetical protein NBRC3255_1095 [Gluconobacter thailandicus NBRC 3255]
MPARTLPQEAERENRFGTLSASGPAIGLRQSGCEKTGNLRKDRPQRR